MAARGARKRKPQISAENLTARITRFTRGYFISRSEVGEGAFIDDEAELVIEAVIEAISPRHASHVGQPITIHLLHAQRYAAEAENTPSFFGSVTFRPGQRSVLAYLPQAPFWELPHMIETGASLLQLKFVQQNRGYGELLSIYLEGGERRVAGSVAMPR